MTVVHPRPKGAVRSEYYTRPAPHQKRRGIIVDRYKIRVWRKRKNNKNAAVEDRVRVVHGADRRVQLDGVLGQAVSFCVRGGVF